MMRIRGRKEWFNAYAAAMLEGDEHKIAERVQSAQGAIESRLAQIRPEDGEANREHGELNYALRYLQLLSVHLCTSKQHAS